MDKSKQITSLHQLIQEFNELAATMAENLPHDENGNLRYNSRAFREWQYTTYTVDSLNKALHNINMVKGD